MYHWMMEARAAYMALKQYKTQFVAGLQSTLLFASKRGKNTVWPNLVFLFLQNLGNLFRENNGTYGCNQISCEGDDSTG